METKESDYFSSSEFSSCSATSILSRVSSESSSALENSILLTSDYSFFDDVNIISHIIYEDDHVSLFEYAPFFCFLFF